MFYKIHLLKCKSFQANSKIINKAENLAYANGLNSIDEILIKGGY